VNTKAFRIWSVLYNSLVTSELHENSYQLLLTKLKQHFIHTAYLEMCTTFGNIHHFYSGGYHFSWVYYVPLGFANSYITLLLVMQNEALAAFYETAFKERYNFSVTSVAQCNTSSMKMKCSLKF